MAVSIKVADVKVGDVLVSTSGGPDMEVLAIERGDRCHPNTVTFRDQGCAVTLGLTDPADREPATTLIRWREGAVNTDRTGWSAGYLRTKREQS
jgi:hypothetical protein